jgi:hypothetical protein
VILSGNRTPVHTDSLEKLQPPIFQHEQFFLLDGCNSVTSSNNLIVLNKVGFLLPFDRFISNKIWFQVDEEP